MKTLLRVVSIFLGLGCMAAAGFLIWNNQGEEQLAQNTSETVVQEFVHSMKQPSIPNSADPSPTLSDSTPSGDFSSADKALLSGDLSTLSLQEIQSQHSDAPVVPAIELHGEPYIGVLSLPSLGLELPVAGTYSETAMTRTPCAYAGSVQEGRIIIGAHNYKAHFANIHQMKPGDQAIFVDAAGQVYTYFLVKQEVIRGDQGKELASGDWNMTLFTCVYGRNTTRTVLRFQEVKPT